MCRTPSTGTAYINSYKNGNEGGITPNSTLAPGWEWWTRSFLISDTQNGQCQTAYNLITGNGVNDIQQNSSTCAWLPGMNAVGNPGQPIPGTCSIPIVSPLTNTQSYTYECLLNDNTTSAVISGFQGAVSNYGIPYTFTMTIYASSGYGFNSLTLSSLVIDSESIDETIPYSNISITSSALTGTVINGHQTTMTITFTDSTFGGPGSIKYINMSFDQFSIYDILVTNIVQTTPNGVAGFTGYAPNTGGVKFGIVGGYTAPVEWSKTNFSITNNTANTAYIRGCVQSNAGSPLNTVNYKFSGIDHIVSSTPGGWTCTSQYLTIAPGITVNNVELIQNPSNTTVQDPLYPWLWTQSFGSGSQVGLTPMSTTAAPTNLAGNLTIGFI